MDPLLFIQWRPSAVCLYSMCLIVRHTLWDYTENTTVVVDVVLGPIWKYTMCNDVIEYLHHWKVKTIVDILQMDNKRHTQQIQHQGTRISFIWNITQELRYDAEESWEIITRGNVYLDAEHGFPHWALWERCEALTLKGSAASRRLNVFSAHFWHLGLKLKL